MRRIRAGWAFAAVVLRQLLHDRTALFFMIGLPIAIIVIIGTSFGGQYRMAVGVLDEGGGNGEIASRLLAQLEGDRGLRVERYDDADALRRAVRRFAVAGGVVVPADADSSVAAGSPVPIGLMILPTSEDAVTVRSALLGALDAVGAPFSAAAFATGAPLPAGSSAVSFDDALAAADRLAASPSADTVAVRIDDVGVARPADESRFSRTAPQNLVLFTFITALTSATLLVRARRAGVLRRALASPTSLAVQLGGMAAGWFVICLLQSVLIIGIGAIGFGVSWGDPVAAAVLVVVFAAVGCGAGLLVGALGANEDRVGALMPIVGIVAGALGGCMVPLEVFPDAMRTVSRAVPHSWAVDAWDQLVRDGAGLGDIASNLGVLAAFAAALVTLAVVAMGRSLSRGT